MTVFSPKESFTDLSHWQQLAFSCALLERMLPNYQLFSQSSKFGDHKVLRNQLDLVWQRLGSGNIKINIDAQLEKLEAQIPNDQEFNYFGVYPAIDVCMALESLLAGLQNNDEGNLDNISRLSLNSVSFYVETLFEANLASEQELASEQQITEHPLMCWEIETQKELHAIALTSKENQTSCKQLKEMALSEGLSNLGIEL